MMMREERAKQFNPFDAMKGLQEALRDREERFSRVERHDISDEAIERNSRVFAVLRKGMRVRAEYYRAFHDVAEEFTVGRVSLELHYIDSPSGRIAFEDVYKIEITQH